MYTPYKFTMPCTGISVPHSSMISLTMALLQNCVNHLVEVQGPLGSSLNASLPRRHVTLKSRPKVRGSRQFEACFSKVQPFFVFIFSVFKSWTNLSHYMTQIKSQVSTIKNKNVFIFLV